MFPKVREETVSVLLSELLEETGITNISLLNIGNVPDIYLLLRGIRIIIEIKEEGNRSLLINQIEGRLEKNLCDLVVGLEYPHHLVRGQLTAPTTKQIRKRLLKEKLNAIVLGHGASGFRVISPFNTIRVTEIPEFLSSVSSEAMPDEEIKEAIDRVRNTIQYFSDGLASFSDAKSYAKYIREELEIGKE